MLEHNFIRPRSIIFQTGILFSRKQKKKEETIEQLYTIIEYVVVENCNSETPCKSEVIRDVIITNMSDTDIQPELLRDTVAPERALSVTTNMEMGHINQQRIAANNSKSGNTEQKQQYNSKSTFTKHKLSQRQ